MAIELYLKSIETPLKISQIPDPEHTTWISKTHLSRYTLCAEDETLKKEFEEYATKIGTIVEVHDLIFRNEKIKALKKLIIKTPVVIYGERKYRGREAIEKLIRELDKSFYTS